MPMKLSEDAADKVSVWKKLAYATGSMPYAMCNTIVGFYFSFFLLEVVILDPLYVLMIVFSGHAWDAITDPLVGYLISFTRTRFGRLRPWMAVSVVPTALFYFFLFYVPPLDDQPQYFKFIYYQIMYLAFQACLTCIHVPYTALTVHLSNSSKERDSVTLYRMCFEVAGTLIGICIYTLFYSLLARGVGDDCNDSIRVPSASLRAAFYWHAFTISIMMVLFVSVTIFGVREQEDDIKVNKKIGFFRGVRETCYFKPYFLLAMLSVFGWLGLQFIQGNTALYIKYAIGLQDEYPYVITVLLLSTIIFMFFWQFIINKFGKKTAFFAGLWALMPVVLSYLYLDRLPRFAYALNAFAGCGVATAYLLPWSMLPDVIDESLLKSTVRREELFYAYFVLGNKFGSGFTLAISTAILKLVGYDEKACVQPWSVPLTMKLLMTVPPIFFILISLHFLWYYPITQKTRDRTKQLLAERREYKSITANGQDTKDPAVTLK